jgi:hypothetical protein
MFTPIQLDKARNLRYGMKAIHLIEKNLKSNISKIDLENLTMEQLAVILWAGLHHEDSTLSPDRVMDLVDDYGGVNHAVEIMGQAFADSFGGDNQNEKNVPTAAKKKRLT